MNNEISVNVREAFSLEYTQSKTTRLAELHFDTRTALEKLLKTTMFPKAF